MTYDQYFGGLTPRTALQWHRACYFLWGTILFWGALFSFGEVQAVIWGGHGPKIPPVAPGLSVALTYTQGQTSKTAHKILISQIALKLRWLFSTGLSHI